MQSRDVILNQQQLISQIAIKHRTPDRIHYLKRQAKYLASTLTKLATSVSLAFSFDKVSVHHLQKSLATFLLAGGGYALGEVISKTAAEYCTNDEEYDFVVKFLVGAVITSYSTTHCLTETKIKEGLAFSFASASELLAVVYLYSGSYEGLQKVLQDYVPNNYALLSSLAASMLVIPGSIASIVEKIQLKHLSEQYRQGAQRSDTALISAGKTPIVNTYFLANRLLIKELGSLPRGFQLGLIAKNILNDIGISRQLRNFPSLLIDVIPQVIRRLLTQLQKIENDYTKNSATHFVLHFDNNMHTLIPTKRHLLRRGDLVWCGSHFDGASSPLSGEVFSFLKNEAGHFESVPIADQEYFVNLKVYTGENTKKKNKTTTLLETGFNDVDQKAIQSGKQLGILEGAEIDFCGKPENFFIRVAPKKELILDTSFEKRSVIHGIINDYKQQNIYYAVLLSLLAGSVLSEGYLPKALTSVRLLFSVFQMMIPFSESFLREMINSKMLKTLNQHIKHDPFETVDALRMVDFSNALAGYYPDKFPQGVAIVSDKTGTLTTLKMISRGMWTPDGSPHENRLQECLTIFSAAYTCSKKELEPEEDAILQHFKQLFETETLLDYESVTKNHFKKKLNIPGVDLDFETLHLGLHAYFGGRFTLVKQQDKYSLVFCGIPKAQAFKNTPLLGDFTTMKTRTGVLSRDWAIARMDISASDFDQLRVLMTTEKKSDIENFIKTLSLQHFKHICTFLIDNPVKENVENFIPQCRQIGVPVFVATGDTEKAARNIAEVLCAGLPTKIITGITDSTLAEFDDVLSMQAHDRPVVIFAEMRTEDKGILAQHLKKTGFFVVANGDGTNDTAMMKVADFVVAHLAPDGSYAPGVSQYANVNDQRLQALHQNKLSFYELFDIHRLDKSRFIQPFIRMSNAQEMVSYALIFKSVKMGMEMAKAFGFDDVEEMPYQQVLGIAFDLTWLWIAMTKISQYAHLPVDNQHLGRSYLPKQCMMIALTLATLEAVICYELLGKSSHVSLLMGMLAVLPSVLSSIFLGFKHDESPLASALQPEVRLSQHRATLFAASQSSVIPQSEKKVVNTIKPKSFSS